MLTISDKARDYVKEVLSENPGNLYRFSFKCFCLTARSGSLRFFFIFELTVDNVQNLFDINNLLFTEVAAPAHL